jgi:hypothetical protein
VAGIPDELTRRLQEQPERAFTIAEAGNGKIACAYGRGGETALPNLLHLKGHRLPELTSIQTLKSFTNTTPGLIIQNVRAIYGNLDGQM